MCANQCQLQCQITLLKVQTTDTETRYEIKCIVRRMKTTCVQIVTFKEITMMEQSRRNEQW